MNKIQALGAELDGLKSAIQAGDDAAMDRAETIINDELPKAKRAAELAKAITGGKVQPEADDAPAKTLGEFAVKNLDLSGIRRGTSRTAATGYGFKAATDPHTAPTVPVLNTELPARDRNTSVRDLFGSVEISGNAYTYFIEGALEGATGWPSAIDENAAKPQIHMPYSPVTVSLEKIAGWFYETDELLEDAPWMASAINNRGLFALDSAIESYLASELAQTSGIQSVNSHTIGTPDAILQAIMDIKTATGLDADAILINPADYFALRSTKDQNDQYMGGGFMYGPYGNGAVVPQPGIWGLNTVITNAIPPMSNNGAIFVGAFRQAAEVVTKANAGARIEIVTGDHDDRTHNRVTVVVEDRLALAVHMPAAFAVVADLGA